MTLQGRDLRMAALPTEGDAPPNEIQPPLRDGVHLRWQFDPEKGPPWYGYYLFRRDSRRKRERHCLASRLRGQEPGAWPSASLPLGFGELDSDAPLRFTDDFPEPGVPELDLADRTRLTLTLPAGQPAHLAEVTIGFRGGCGKGEGRRCVEFGEARAPEVPNPLREGGATLVALGPEGRPRPSGRIVGSPEGRGWDVGFGAVIALPCPADRVELELWSGAHAPEVEALDRAGDVVDKGSPSSNPGPVQLAGKGIERLVIRAPQDETVLLRLCWACGEGGRPKPGGGVEIIARLEGVEVARTELAGEAGEVQRGTLAADAFDEVEVGHGDAALVDLCVSFVSDSLRGGGWKPLRRMPCPLPLPVAHADYPCPGAPSTRADAEAAALDRVAYGSPSEWEGAPFDDLHNRLEQLVAGGPPPGGEPMASRSESVVGSPAPPAATGGEIRQSRQRPLDLLLLGSMHPPIAEQLGFAWFDEDVTSGRSYDYLLLADHDGSLGGDATSALQWLASVADFSVVDGFACFGVTAGPAEPLSPPTGARAYALPGSTVVPEAAGGLIDASNNAGLIWNRRESGELLEPGAPIMYHVWRAGAGDGEAAETPEDTDFKLATTNGPLPVTRSRLSPPTTPSRPEDWPPFALHYIDRGLPDGWFAYRVSAIDVFGRHSANGSSAQWRQWTPAPKPKPWYYVDPPADRQIDPAAVRLLSKLPPPPPPAVEAFALDPDDPTVLKDSRWQAWRNSLTTAERKELVGLRVRWRWDPAQQQQAPRVREFRIYYEPAPANTLRGRVASVSAAGTGESRVLTDIANSQPADAFAGASVQIGAHSFSVLGSEAGNPLALRVANLGPAATEQPPAGARIAVTLPAGHPDFTDLSAEAGWERRMLTVGYGDHVSVDTSGVRSYEVLLPVAGSADRTGLPLAVTLAEPVATGLVGVTAADDRKHALDPRGDPARYGNESRIGGPATVLRVRRTPPPAPPDLPDSAKVFASPADYHGNSYYTFRWTPAPRLKTFVYRALDDAVFRADLAQRPRPSLDSKQGAPFPSDWEAQRRQQVATELNALNSLDPSAPETALATYASLSNDALRVLAALPGSERVFAQLNPQPLDPEEPDPGAPGGLRWRRVGADLAPATLATGLRAFVDTLDGRGANRWFYRAAYVDEVYNVGPLGLPSPPVWLPDVVPPVAPRIVRLAAGDRQVTIEWASNREPDLAEYRVYRTDDPEAARDVRLMTLVHSEPVTDEPAARPATVTWTDDPVPGLRDLWYCLVAVDRVEADPGGAGGNASDPSPAMRTRAYDQTPPDPPTFVAAEWVRVDEAGVAHAWSEPVPEGAEREPGVRLAWEATDPETKLLVQVKGASDPGFSPASGWLPPGATGFLHRTTRTFESQEYRLKAVSGAGNVNTAYHPTTLSPP